MKLTPAQKQEIRKVAIEECYEDARSDADYLSSIVAQWVDGMSVEDQLQAISNDPDAYQHLLSFDPESGKPWPDTQTLALKRS